MIIKIRKFYTRHLFVVSIVCFFAQSTSADTFFYEGEIRYSDSDGPFTDTTKVALAGNYYLKPVTDKQGPLAEAAFISQSSRLSAYYARTKSEAAIAFTQPATLLQPPSVIDPMIGGVTSTNFDFAQFNPVDGAVALVSPFSFANRQGTDTDRYGVDLRYVFANDWIVGGNIDLARSDDEIFMTRMSLEEVDYRVEIGKYIRPLTTVTMSFRSSHTDADTDSDFQLCFLDYCTVNVSTAIEHDIDMQELTLHSKHLFERKNSHHMFSTELGFAKADVDTTITNSNTNTPESFGVGESDWWRVGFGYVFYPTTRLGLGIDYDYRNAGSDGGHSDAISVNASWFVTHRFYFRASYSDDNVSISPTRANLKTISFGGRF